jgi:hypothetical protein
VFSFSLLGDLNFPAAHNSKDLPRFNDLTKPHKKIALFLCGFCLLYLAISLRDSHGIEQSFKSTLHAVFDASSS